MLKKITILFAMVIAVHAEANLSNAQVYVQGHFRSNGTYVQSHYRSQPDGNFYNNWSTYPNTNPYTGSMGTRRSPSLGGNYSNRATYSYPSYNDLRGYGRVPMNVGW